MINGFAINWINKSLFYCKFRAFYVQSCVLISFTCMCLAIIDQFLATCSNPRWNNIKLARYLVIGIVVILDVTWNPVRNVLQSHSIAYNSTLPVAIMILFGILAYRNVQHIAYRTVPLVQRELDKQLTVMVLVQVFYDVLAVTPLIIQSVYFIVIGTPIHICLSIKMISSTVNLCSVYSSSQSMVSSKNDQ